MKIRCLHGYFIFEETKVGQVSDFISRYGLPIVSVGRYFTFEALSEAEGFSIPGRPYLNVTATVQYEGEPWEVMRANNLVYDFNKGLLVPISSVTQRIPLSAAGNRYVSSGLILPGSVMDGSSRVKDYAAWFSRDTYRFLYSEVSFE